jgi:hypothetical protein
MYQRCFDVPAINDMVYMHMSHVFQGPLPSDKVHLVVPAGPPISKRWVGVLNTGHFFISVSNWSLGVVEATLAHSQRQVI